MFSRWLTLRLRGLKEGKKTPRERLSYLPRIQIAFNELGFALWVYETLVLRFCACAVALNSAWARETGTNGLFREPFLSNLIEVMADERWKRLAEQQGIAYAKTVAEAMDLKLDADNPADREKLRRAVLDLVAGRKMPKQKGASLSR